MVIQYHDKTSSFHEMAKGFGAERFLAIEGLPNSFMAGTESLAT